MGLIMLGWDRNGFKKGHLNTVDHILHTCMIYLPQCQLSVFQDRSRKNLKLPAGCKKLN